MRRFALALLLASLGCAARAASQGALFEAPAGSPVRVGQGPGRVLLVDVDRDGRLDLVTNHLLPRRISVHLGDGGGGFRAAPGSPLVREYMPGDIGLGDVDGDGIVDLAVTRSDRDVVELFLGDGTGAFRPAPRQELVVSGSTEFFTRSLHLVDLNEDGHLDVVTATDGRNGAALPATLLGDGRGGFAAGPALPLDPGGGGYSFAFADVDGDGHLDVATASRGEGAGLAAGRLVVQRGRGDGTFHAAGPPLSVPPSPRLGRLADVSGDGRPDVVLTHGGASLLTVLLNGGGGFAPAPGSPFQVGTPAFSVAVADANRDGRPDLLATTVQNQAPPFESAVTVLLGHASGFATAPGSPFRTGPGSYRLAVGDVDGDGRVDVVASSVESDGVAVLLGR